MVNPTQGRFAVAVFICAVVTGVSVIYFLVPEVPFPIRLGERQVYGIYLGGNKVGTLELWVSGTVAVEGEELYISHYNLSYSDVLRSGLSKFDGMGRLHRFEATQRNGEDLEWRVEVSYLLSDNRMGVIIEDNRDPDNYRTADSYMSIEGVEIMMPEHVWYYLGFQELYPEYQYSLRLNLLPNPVVGSIAPAQNTVVTLRVTGSETVETSVGSFECWMVEGGENTRLAAWPIDRIWVAKESGLVVKGIENQDGDELIFMLEEK